MITQSQERCVATIDIGGSTTKIGLVTANGLLPGRSIEFSTPAKGDPDAFLAAMTKEITLLHREGVQIFGLGVAVPGFLSAGRKSVEYCPNTPMLVGYPWRNALQQSLGISVSLEVDCNAAALGEHVFGGGQGVKRLLVLSLGTGVGAGMLIDGKPLRFAGECCGDAGHVYVGGKLTCSAGCKGCLEAEVSVSTLGGSATNVRQLISRALSGEPCSMRTLRDAGHRIGRAVASLSSCFHPELVLLAGGIAEAGDLLTVPAMEAFAEYGALHFQVPIRKAALGGAAALSGAAVALLSEDLQHKQIER